MNTYEGMVIFPDRLQDEETEEELKGVRLEIEKHGGEILGSTRLGRRQFARPIQKDEFGHYAVVSFRVDGEMLPKLHARFRLNDRVTRVQIVRVTNAEVAPVAVENES